MVDESGSGSGKINNTLTNHLGKNIAELPKMIAGFKDQFSVAKDGTGGTGAIAGLREDNVNELRQLFKMPTNSGARAKQQDASRTF